MFVEALENFGEYVESIHSEPNFQVIQAPVDKIFAVFRLRVTVVIYR